jgi:DNA-binding transcriptional LysR family regulator
MAGPGAFWLLWPPGAQQTAKLRAFIDFFGPRLFSRLDSPL